MDVGDSRPIDAAMESDEPPPALKLDIVIDDEIWLTFGAVEAAAEAAARALASAPRLAAHLPAEACLALSGDTAVADLNRTYRGKDTPTNVLSFPARPMPGDAAEGPAFLGDLILAAGVVRSEAADLGIPILHHVQHLVVHGLLHLLAYDHETDADATVMERLETEILATLGIPDPYAISAEDRPARS